MSERRFVYNPADPDFERNSFRYNNVVFKLEPSSPCELLSPWPSISAQAVMDVCLEQLGPFGVVEIKHSDVPDLWNANVRAAKEAGEEIHEAHLRKVHGKVVNAYAEKVAYAKGAGVEMKPTEKVQRSMDKLREWEILLSLVLLILLSATAGAQTVAPRVVAAKYDLDATSFTCFVLEPQERQGEGRIQTSGSNQTVTAVGSATPFTDIAVNDQLIITTPLLGTVVRTVIARASATSITVDTAINLSAGAGFAWKRLNAGATAADGWFGMSRRRGTISVYFAQATVTGGINIRADCATTMASGVRRPHQIYPSITPPNAPPTYTTYSSFPNNLAIDVANAWDVCRVCAYIVTSDASDTGTDQEQIDVAVEFGEVVR